MHPHVLVVEDDYNTRIAIRAMLEVAGCTVDEAPDGEKAIGAVTNKHYDVIILDIALPKMSGTDVMEYIASTKPQVLAAVVVVTGLEVGEVRKLFPTVCETLSKPIMPSRLLASVRRCLRTTTGEAGIFVA